MELVYQLFATFLYDFQGICGKHTRTLACGDILYFCKAPVTDNHPVKNRKFVFLYTLISQVAQRW